MAVAEISRIKDPYETIKTHEQNFTKTGERMSKMENVLKELHQTMASLNLNIEYLLRKANEGGSGYNGGNKDRAEGSENAKARQEMYTPPHLRNQSNQQNSISVAHKVEFPEFNGDNPQKWIRKANRFFELNPKENRKVLHAGYYMIDTADTWYTEYVEGRAEVEWENFCEMLLQRFLSPGGEEWTSVLAVVPVLAVSSGIPSSSMAVVSEITTGINMAETIAQGPSRAQTTPQSPLGTQRIEELAIKQSRQLIPVTPALPKTLVINTSDKHKTKLAQHHPSASSPLSVTHSPRRGPLNDAVSKGTNSGRLHVLKPVREKNGVVPVMKNTSNPTNGSKVASSTVTSITRGALDKPVFDRFDRKPVLTVLKKRPTSLAKSRNDFFNLLRKKSIPNTSSAIENSSAAFESSVVGGALVVTGEKEIHGKTEDVEGVKMTRIECVRNAAEEQNFNSYELNVDGVIFKSDTKQWSALVSEVYLDSLSINWSRVRNVMERNAGYGGFASAIINLPLWVMNVIPSHEPDTLPVNFDGELIGVYQDWCEFFNTFPRTYDLLHASFLGNLTKRCDIIEIAAETEDIFDIRNLNTISNAAKEVKESLKLRQMMQTILTLGNALNQGTTRGSDVGFKLDSLLKIAYTRARDNKMTLMHYLCKIIAEKMPELLDFSKDFLHLEPASKIQLKSLAEEMQAVSKGLEKVEHELTVSENDGDVSLGFRKVLKGFLDDAEAEVRSLIALYSEVGRNADSLSQYIGQESKLVTDLACSKLHLFKYQGHVSTALVLGGIGVTGLHLHMMYLHKSTNPLPFATMGINLLTVKSVFEAKCHARLTREVVKLVAEARCSEFTLLSTHIWNPGGDISRAEISKWPIVLADHNLEDKVVFKRGALSCFGFFLRFSCFWNKTLLMCECSRFPGTGIVVVNGSGAHYSPGLAFKFTSSHPFIGKCILRSISLLS